MKIVLATRNEGKIAELRAMIADLPVVLLSASEIAGAPDVEETAHTLEENAALKAGALASHTGLPALADDTGLEVAVLGGRPGVNSARFAGPDADDAANRQRLLADIDAAADRSARFRTVLAFAYEGEVSYFEGACEGSIARAERGDGGFGYDSIFVPRGEIRTFAEMTTAEKNTISHRRRAIDEFVRYLRSVAVS